MCISIISINIMSQCMQVRVAGDLIFSKLEQELAKSKGSSGAMNVKAASKHPSNEKPASKDAAKQAPATEVSPEGVAAHADDDPAPSLCCATCQKHAVAISKLIIFFRLHRRDKKGTNNTQTFLYCLTTFCFCSASMG